jgi:pyrrolidone-carboxylate peptidase
MTPVASTVRASAAAADAAQAGKLLMRKCACGNHASGGECESCSGKRLQRKALTLGPAQGPLEDEADRVASAVMSDRAAAVSGGQALGVSRAPQADADSGVALDGAAPDAVHEVLRAPGQALDRGAREFMEPRFGRDFSHVRVHADASAQASATAVGAAAYTVGSHLVFGAGRYRPDTPDGQALLAHELTHVLQQDAGAASLQRQPVKGGGAKPAPFIKEVVVDQNAKQRVTATFSDGTTFSDHCSTGKGHCCFDASAGTAEGGACSASRSNQVGNNCTPVGTFTVTSKRRAGPIPFWTQFHDAKSVALHQYTPVTGEPLSHGCVRLDRATAQTIFDGARVGATRVKVTGLAKPNCADPDVQAEWSDDFRSAGSKPPDGETIRKFSDKPLTDREVRKEIEDAARHIRETRSELRSALGVDDKALDTEIAGPNSGSPIAPKIPRCVPALTNEEKQLPNAKDAGFLDAAAAKTAAAFSKALARSANAAAAEKLVKTVGEKLWRDATAAARGGGAGSDDRQIYWTRLMLSTALRQWNPAWARTADDLRRVQTRLLQVLEQSSRGMNALGFGQDVADRKRILVSGFDPFGFPNAGDIRQSNLSGAAALALDGQTLSDGKVSGLVRSVVYPVRYADFDAGVVERVLQPLLAGSNPPQLVMSISQGGGRFELEEFAGRRRSTAGFNDNLDRAGGGGTLTKPIEPPALAKGPEFIGTNVKPTTLAAMRGALGRKGALREETEVKDLPSGASQPRTLPKGPGTKPSLAVEGSGGGFLSNEVFYRNSLMRTQGGANVPTIHLHTPMLEPDAGDSTRNTLIESIRKILRAALATL